MSDDLTPLQQAITEILDDRDATPEEIWTAQRIAELSLKLRRSRHKTGYCELCRNVVTPLVRVTQAKTNLLLPVGRCEYHNEVES